MINLNLAKKNCILSQSNTLIDLHKNSINILLVEDSRIAQIAALNLLDSEEIHTEAVATGEKAIERFKQHKYDLILLDVGLPDMDGFTIAKNIRIIEKEKNMKRTPIIILTAHSDTTPTSFNQNLFDQVLIKPLTQNIVSQVKKDYLNTD